MIQHFRAQADGTLADRVQDFEISTEMLQQLLSLGAIYCNGRRLFQGHHPDQDLTQMSIHTDDVLRVHFRPRRFFWAPEDVKSWIRHESEHTLLIEKPTGLPVHATLDNAQEHLLAHLNAAGYPEALMVHRLDIGTEGLMLFAKHPEAQRDLQFQMQNREILKSYCAVVEGFFPLQGEMMTWMQKSPRAPKLQHFSPGADRESCLSIVKDSQVIDMGFEGQPWSQVKIELITGRTHQIRSQLQAFGHAIVGDKMYGSEWGWLASRNLKNQQPQNESWALRCQALGWCEAGVDYIYELADFTDSDLRLRTKSFSSILSQSDFGSYVGPQSTRSLHKNPPEIQSIAARHFEDAHEQQSQKPQ